MAVLKANLVVDRTTSIPEVPSQWNAGPGFFYQLNLNMCQMTELVYGFAWGKRVPGLTTHSILEEPEKILALDLSLNDITSLEHKSLAPFHNLRALKGSLNRIDRYVGIEVCKNLHSLDLSHNCIHKLEGLHACQRLIYVNLGANAIADISVMPALLHLAELHLHDNKLKSIDGVQALPNLQELYVQKNRISDILQLASSFRLRVLNASDNDIGSLRITTEVLGGLKRLETLNLHGNPIDAGNTYQSELLNRTTVVMLDNVLVRHLPTHQVTNSTYPGGIVSIREATKQAFHQELADHKQAVEREIRFLRGRIIGVEDEYKDYEEKRLRDLDSCLRHMDSLSHEEVQKRSDGFSHSRVCGPSTEKAFWPTTGALGGSRPGWYWRTPGGASHQIHKADYAGVKRTDEVLRCAYNELARKKSPIQK